MYKTKTHAAAGYCGMEVVPQEAQDSEGLQAVEPTLLGHKENAEAAWGPDLNAPRKRMILGLSVGVFWIVILVISMLIAGGIGAGVGVGLSQKQNSKASATR